MTRYYPVFKFFTLCLLILWIALGCKPPQKQPSASTAEKNTIEFDSVQKVLIDSMVRQINIGLGTLGPPQKLPYPLYTPVDTIYYWIVNKHSARISIEWNPPQMTIWPTFFVYKGDLVMVRYRYMTELPPTSHASESMIYLHHEKIVYCEERRIELKEGDFPGMLRQLPFAKSTRTYEEIEKDYKDYWKTVIAYMKQYNALPPMIMY